MELTQDGLSEERSKMEAAISAHSLCPPQTKRSLGTGNEGQMGEGSCVERERERFPRDLRASWIVFRERKIGICLWQKRRPLTPPLLPIWKDPVSVCTPRLSDPVSEEGEPAVKL